jgi:hypothetical protein
MENNVDVHIFLGYFCDLYLETALKKGKAVKER